MLFMITPVHFKINITQKILKTNKLDWFNSSIVFSLIYGYTTTNMAARSAMTATVRAVRGKKPIIPKRAPLTLVSICLEISRDAMYPIAES